MNDCALAGFFSQGRQPQMTPNYSSQFSPEFLKMKENGRKRACLVPFSSMINSNKELTGLVILGCWLFAKMSNEYIVKMV